MEGLQIFKVYLRCFGFSSLEAELSKSDKLAPSPRYTEYHGGVDAKQRSKNLEHFNEKSNSHGETCKIMMISPAGAEGISLMNVRQVHLMEPYWHEVRMIQMIGRAVRMCSHKDLPFDERHVDIYRYKSVRAKGTVDPRGENKPKGNMLSVGEKWTTDQYIEDLARGKEGLNQSFLDAMKEAAVDCVLNKSHNALVQDFKCFQFDETSLFDDQVGPAYKEDIFDDMKMDNGSNSTKSQTLRIKVIKISAVKQLTFATTEKDKIKYSSSDYYWYNPLTGIVYDYELYYPIGKIGNDDNELPLKIDKDTYIIDKMIPIPMIEENQDE